MFYSWKIFLEKKIKKFFTLSFSFIKLLSFFFFFYSYNFALINEFFFKFDFLWKAKIQSRKKEWREGETFKSFHWMRLIEKIAEWKSIRLIIKLIRCFNINFLVKFYWSLFKRRSEKVLFYPILVSQKFRHDRSFRGWVESFYWGRFKSDFSDKKSLGFSDQKLLSEEIISVSLSISQQQHNLPNACICFLANKITFSFILSN